jgi:Sigma-70, region 4
MGIHLSIHAVLTGDIVNSTALSTEMEKSLYTAIQQALSPYLIEFYRGDSFQTYLEDPAVSLRKALLCRALTISLTAAEEGPGVSDIRISIGLGEVEGPVRAPGLARGGPFLLSGRGLDELQKTEQRLKISSGNTIADIGLQAMADHLDAIYRDLTPKQAAVICLLLEGVTQQEAATQLGKSKSTVSQLVAAGSWAEIEKILQQFETLINQLS